jgi:uncharacterized membrane protein YagU involved in acid resistance
MDNKNKKGQKQGVKPCSINTTAHVVKQLSHQQIKTVQTVDHIIFEVLLDFGFSVLLHVLQQRLSLNLYKSIWPTETVNPLP